MSFYNNFASYYDKWVSNDSEANTLTKFYSDYISKIHSSINVVYLAIATGRIALKIAKNNANHIVGIELSQAMIDICKQNFINAKKENQLTLLKQDILSLHVSTKNNIFILPFRTFAHFISQDDKIKCLTSVYENMQVGETFIFDADIFDEKKAKEINNKHQLGYHDIKSGEVIYNMFQYNFEMNYAEVSVYTATLKDKKLENLSTYNYKISWISVKDLKSMIENIGFIIQETILTKSHQIWILKK